MAAQKILVVDDEKRIVEIISAYLQKEGYSVITAYDGKTALELAGKESPALIILDLMLPEITGWDVCRTLRRESDIAIIMLTARDDTTDKVVGLELGADDYVTKPFDPKELMARVHAVLRRKGGEIKTQTVLKVGALEIDTEKRQVIVNEKTVELTAMEFDLLRTMAANPGRVYNRMQLLDSTQGDAYEGYERTIDSHIKNLRKKIEPDPDHPAYVITVHGVGYKVEGPTCVG